MEIKIRDKGIESVVPFPICDKCGKEVDVFKIKIEPNDVKFEAECHGGYEMYRVNKDALLGVSTIQKGLAFKNNNNRSYEIILKESW